MINGPAKSGTHLLAVHRLDPDIRHDPSLPCNIIRNPRNILISRVRAWGRPIEKELLLTLDDLEQWEVDGVRFEDLPDGPPTETWTGRHSNWTEWWTPEIDALWGERGRKLEKEWGYEQ